LFIYVYLGLNIMSLISSYQPFGAAAELFASDAAEFVLEGAAGTGKSRACLEKLHRCAMEHAGMRALIVRKTRTSLTQTGLVTFERQVLPVDSGIKLRSNEQEYRYPNGSVIAVDGLDRPTKVMSAEYDLIFVQEATEVSEYDWEMLSTRLRNGIMPYQQLIGDCNPDAPSHWLKRRADAGKTTMRASHHEDNPMLFDQDRKEWTQKGKEYIVRLEQLSGVRYQRLRLGLWVQAEGIVYESFNRAVHIVVCQFWAEDECGRLYRYREIYKTKRLVEDHARHILELAKDEPRPAAIICDTDAEDRATLERHLKMQTVPAFKSVSPGIQAVESRLRLQADGKPRLFLLRDSLVERDELLQENKKPCSTEEEIESYVWDTAAERPRGEQPVKKDDHGVDALRYLCAELDLRRSSAVVASGQSFW
jgi:hypothetical protein